MEGHTDEGGICRESGTQHDDLTIPHLGNVHGSRVLHEAEYLFGDLAVGIDHQVVFDALEEGVDRW